MGETTGISWTHHTFNPWWGCTKVSSGCDNCYAETFDKRTGGNHWGKGAARRTFGDKHWNEPLKWNRDAEREGRKHLVFCASMADVMDDEAPDGQRERLWALIDSTPNLIWQLLSKRPQRFVEYLPHGGFKHGNVWLGATAENQEQYRIRLPHLMRAAVALGLISFISYEPALGPLKFFIGTPDWLIFGGETGPNRRPCELAWLESIAEQCAMFGVALFVKQMSARTPTEAKALIPERYRIEQFPLGEPA